MEQKNEMVRPLEISLLVLGVATSLWLFILFFRFWNRQYLQKKQNFYMARKIGENSLDGRENGEWVRFGCPWAPSRAPSPFIATLRHSASRTRHPPSLSLSLRLSSVAVSVFSSIPVSACLSQSVLLLYSIPLASPISPSLSPSLSGLIKSRQNWLSSWNQMRSKKLMI